ncbi:MAG: DNA-protecting protein DprA, partial [Actinobacteria bacterium]|nr:DNA-protecting protein DprA [Actinomycetota bacterium]
MEDIARLRLFQAIDGGSPFWTEEFANYGGDELITRILAGKYDASKRSSARIKSELLKNQHDGLIEEIGSSGARFITPASEEWPQGLNDLVAPPFGLIIKGSPVFSTSVAIVGTRNPTTYGARIASEFASGFADRDLAIISGGAYGIDSHAHRGCIAAEGKTFA